MKNNIFKAFIIGNIYCIIFAILGFIFKFGLINIANGLFYSMALYIIVGLIAFLSPRKTLRKNGEESDVEKTSLREKLSKGKDTVSQGYRIFIYCFEICIIIIAYSYVLYEVGVR
ncbi:hypothetical protein [Clostridium frigidicarnis]|uniref:DUF3899 domain-containing protein n=1 Tax=Clostridium frigidicarnis TaxID=84698 RepID=A0A1I0Z959_9CLOT|nr:hypothetical protein [Clostridium frigidicarnis]SFB21952.1 hypothetical protein SAMN04488528_101851 [Clostridium frigidicarnis]